MEVEINLLDLLYDRSNNYFAKHGAQIFFAQKVWSHPFAPPAIILVAPANLPKGF